MTPRAADARGLSPRVGLGADRSPRSGRRSPSSTTGVVVAIVLAFLLLPIVALVTYQPVGRLLHEFNTQVTSDAIGVSLKTNLIAMGLTLLLGTPFAYAIARHRFPGRSILITLVEVPLVLPPAVAGIALLVAYGRLGLLGHQLTALGVDLGFTQAAVVMAIILVASPFYLRGAIGAFEAVDPTLLDVAGTLGAGRLRRMIRVALPLARAGLGASAALCFARGIGEFGARSSSPGASRALPQPPPPSTRLFDSTCQAIAVGVLLPIVSGRVSSSPPNEWVVDGFSRITTSLSRGGPSTSARSSA